MNGLGGYGWLGMFAVGSAMLSFTLAGTIRIGRTSRLAFMLERLRERERLSRLTPREAEKRSAKERAFLEKARLAGVSAQWSFARYRQLQGLLGATLAGLLGMAYMAAERISGTAFSFPPDAGLVVKLILGFGAGWSLPHVGLLAAGHSRKARLLMEIAKLSHRLSVCVSERADIRELLLRAGRPLVLLKPYLQELAVLWGKDRGTAIRRFRDGVGISEAYPLVNALEAIRRADSHEVAKVLKEQTAGIEATLSAEINRKLENAPIWISFYIMVPFAVIVLLFLYPWLVSISEQLRTSFQG